MEDRTLMDDMTYKILKIVHDKPGITKTNIVKYAGAAPRVNKIVSQMINDKILLEFKHGQYNVKTYELTDYGKNIFYAMDALKHTINGKSSTSDEVSASSRGLQDITTK